ncbi:hypothetical protein [Bowmanella dokdonensis]|uniref:Uncharacterized protein n=1 Tax=Bowmanella dokdonensis TaxID=751969 RepID=A0A939DKD4_9ALTE|nr:hypothetical protein [Bowmanella dokdonensis]MBN7823917.1 hypothetical protein [Bowmanella dokdonensis]
MLLYASILILWIVPMLMGFWHWLSVRKRSLRQASRAGLWRLTLCSTLYCVLAFNLTFFIQEVFLVLPKALTPGLIPVIYHNNHSWSGEHPLMYLFQGTGALATFLLGLACLWRVRGKRPESANGQLFMLWMAFSGLFMALPQLVIGALNPYNDVGMAMDYFQLSPTSKQTVAFLALLAMPLFSLSLIRPFMALAGTLDPAWQNKPMMLMYFILTLPAFLAIPLIVAYRVPREMVEVLALPLIVLLSGLVWMQFAAYRFDNQPLPVVTRPPSWRVPLFASLALLLVFQVLLRPGIVIAFH